MTVNFEKYDLQRYETAIQSVAKNCTFGISTDEKSDSFFGGLPLVDHDFTWPTDPGRPLNFVGQLSCSELETIPVNHGNLLFFYDDRYWELDPKARGHAVVIHQSGERLIEQHEVPRTTKRKLFGLIRCTARTKVYQKTYVDWVSGLSYPSWQRGEILFDNDDDEDRYVEFYLDRQSDIQVGGFPNPIQTDEMELDCVDAFAYGAADDWLLLLQLFELGDMNWGDAGALYWFIHKNDLASGRFDRVWMVAQSH
ncbi:MAG: DUF1963 domain-containing protein [Novipirellula sp. JB048]